MSATSTAPRWIALDRTRDPGPGQMTAARLDGRYLVVGRRDDGSPFAVDGRCPHEGYPLVQGDVKDCTLTCTWHNWKFDVSDGACLLGGEDVRAFPAREVDGRIEVDVSDPDPESLRPALRRSLEQAFFDHDVPRALRDAVRLLATGEDPWRLLADVARYDAEHAEYGSSHTLPLTTDCGRQVTPGSGPAGLRSLAPVLEMCAESNVRLPAHPLVDTLPDPTEAALRDAVENEDGERALGLLRGAFAAGHSRASIESWLLATAADHFTNFGHQLIYLIKTSELLDHLDAETERTHAEAVYTGWLRGLLFATREDTLPYWRVYADRLAAVSDALPQLAANARPGASHDGPGLRDAILDGSAEQALDLLVANLRTGAPAADIAPWLVAAAAQRLLRFDVALDSDPTVAEGWLWATHRFTFASAVHAATRRTTGPEALRLLFHCLAFTHSGGAMDRAPGARLDILPRADDLPDLQALAQALADRDAPRALRLTAAWLAADRDDGPLRDLILDRGRGDGLVRPIVVAHAIKTTVAAWEEYDALAGHPDRALPVLAAVNLLASPVVERRIGGLVDEAIGWVVDKRLPRKLTQ